MNLPPHQQRVVDEKRDLDEKIVKLMALISVRSGLFDSLPEAERGRLREQSTHMLAYSDVLARRIEAFVGA